MNKVFNSIRILIFSSLLVQSNAVGFTAQQAEVITAIARGPLAMLSQRHHGDYSKKAKFIHVATDLTRLANTILSMVNHQDDLHHASFAWIFIDIANLIRDLKTKNVMQEDSDPDLDVNMYSETELCTEESLVLDEKTTSLNHIVQASQKYLLPFVESTASLLIATNADQTPQGGFDRRHMRAACSLARALSVFANHRKSIPAIALLLGAVTEMILVIQEMREAEQDYDNTYENAHDPGVLENLANDLRQQNLPAANDPHIRAIQRRINQLRNPPANHNIPQQDRAVNLDDPVHPHNQAQQLEDFVNLLIQNNRYQENSPFIQDLRNRIRQLRR